MATRSFVPTFAALLLLGAGCSSAPSPAAPTDAASAVVTTPRPMDDVTCENLLTTAEVETIVGTDVVPVGRRASSCYWLQNGSIVQVVFNTTNAFPAWREELLTSFTQQLSSGGADLRAEPGSESVAAFGPGRGVIVHGVADREAAAALALLALGRL